MGLKFAGLNVAVLAFVLVGCDQDPQKVAYQGRVQPRTVAEVEFVISFLATLQERSITENLEYCGFIIVNSEGEVAASPPLQGQDDGCRPDEPADGADILASYHTHAAYAPDYDSEVPSYDDLRADVLEGIDGYVATPGGRVWYNSAKTKRATLLCGEGCIISDPKYRAEPDFPVADNYDLNGLQTRE